jgi:DNA end-binding protein Ku
MATRPTWKGYLKLALVTCPVALFTATSTTERISFHTYNRETGHRVRRQYIDAESGEVVEQDEQVRGYDLKNDGFVEIEDEEYASVALESTHTIDIDKFVPRSQVDEIYIDTPYYLIPTDKVGEEAFAVIREAMRVRKMVGLARVVLFRRERVVMLEPREKGMLVTTLHYATEVREDDDYFAEIEDTSVSKEMLDLAGHIIDTKMSRFDPREFKDRYEEALRELVKAKAKGKKLKPAPGPRKPANVVSLMDALRKSLGTSNDNEEDDEEVDEPAKPASRSRTSKAKASGGAKKKPPTKPTRKAG